MHGHALLTILISQNFDYNINLCVYLCIYHVYMPTMYIMYLCIYHNISYLCIYHISCIILYHVCVTVCVYMCM